LEPFDLEDPSSTPSGSKHPRLLHFELSEEFAWLKLAFWILVVLVIATAIVMVILRFTEGPSTDDWVPLGAAVGRVP
jgi:hypothetical protein